MDPEDGVGVLPLMNSYDGELALFWQFRDGTVVQLEHLDDSDWWEIINS